MTPDTLKIIGLAVGSFGTIVSAIAKVVDERDASRVRAEEFKTAESGKALAFRPRNKRSLFVAIISLAVAVLGFAVSFEADMAQQRFEAESAKKQAALTQAALESAKKQAELTQETLEGVRKTLTRIQDASVEMGITVWLNPAKTKALGELAAKLEHAVQVATAQCTPVNKTVLGNVRVLWNEHCNPAYFDYEFSYDEARCLRSFSFNDISCMAPTVLIFKPPISRVHLIASLHYGTGIPALRLPLPSFNGQLKFTKNVKDRAIQYAELLTGRIEIPRKNWEPTGAVRSIDELAGAQVVVHMPAPPVSFWRHSILEFVRIYLNGERFDVTYDQMDHLESDDDMIYSYVFPSRVTK